MDSEVSNGGSKDSEGLKKNGKKQKKASDIRWVIKTFFVTFIISVLLSFVSESVTVNINIAVAVLFLFAFIFLGIIFDIIGVAVTTADSKNFNSMAARKIQGARVALWCIFKAPEVSNFCNDMIGDISGIISGSMGAVVALSLSSFLPIPKIVSTILITGIISSITVGGKAIGKKIAIEKSNEIVFFVAKILSIVLPESLFYKK